MNSRNVQTKRRTCSPTYMPTVIEDVGDALLSHIPCVTRDVTNVLPSHNTNVVGDVVNGPQFHTVEELNSIFPLIPTECCSMRRSVFIEYLKNYFNGPGLATDPPLDH